MEGCQYCNTLSESFTPLFHQNYNNEDYFDARITNSIEKGNSIYIEQVLQNKKGKTGSGVLIPIDYCPKCGRNLNQK